MKVNLINFKGVCRCFLYLKILVNKGIVIVFCYCLYKCVKVLCVVVILVKVYVVNMNNRLVIGFLVSLGNLIYNLV